MRTVDIHTHGIGGYDTVTTNPDEIIRMAQLHGSRGVTDIIPTIYPGPLETMREQMAAVRRAMELQAGDGSPLGAGHRTAISPERRIQDSGPARIAGINLEGPFLNPTMAGALDATSFQMPSEHIWERLVKGFEDVVRIVTIAPELEGAISLIHAISETGIIVSLGHSDATYREAEEASHAGAKGITHLFNAMRGIRHREPGIAGFGLTSPHIYVEIIGDPFHLNPWMIDLVFRVKDPGKIIIVSDSVKNTEASAGRDTVESNRGIIEGGSMTITRAAKRLIDLGFAEMKVRSCITDNPLNYLSGLSYG